MHKTGLIKNVSSKNIVPSIKDMQVLDIQSKAYYNFINSIKSQSTRKSYTYCLEKFLVHYNTDLDQFLKLSQDEMTNLIIKYLVDNKISNQYKNLINSTLKHACEINDVVLNWKKIKKFINYEKTGNETNGRDRGYTDIEIQKILEFSDQRMRTAFLILASTGIRIGALQSLRINDIEKMDNLYKVMVYSGDKEEYFTFCTPECAKEIDSYLEFRKRRGESMTGDSYLLVKQFDIKNGEFTGEPFGIKSLRSVLEDYILISGIRKIDHENPHKRKQIPIFHGFRKFFTKQLVDSKLYPEIREMLLGHKIGLTSAYYKPTEQEMLNEYLKAIDFLTISKEQKLENEVNVLAANQINKEKEIKIQLFNKEQQISKLKETNISNSDAIAALSEMVIELTEEIDKLKKRLPNR